MFRSVARACNGAYKLGQSTSVPGTAVRTNNLLRSHSTWSYRTAPPAPEKHLKLMAELTGGVLWWWVLWHCWHDYGHIVGEFPMPDPAKWTDEELGIPPDSTGASGRLA